MLENAKRVIQAALEGVLLRRCCRESGAAHQQRDDRGKDPHNALILLRVCRPRHEQFAGAQAVLQAARRKRDAKRVFGPQPFN